MIRLFRTPSVPDCPRLLHVTTVPQTLCFLVGHAAHAKDKGFDVHVMSSPGESLEELGRQMQVEVHPVEMPRRITPLRDLGAMWRIAHVMRHVRPTIVHGHTPKGGLLAMMAAALCRVPVRIYHLHGLPVMTATGMKRLLLGWSERTACALAHQVFCVSPSLREVAIELGLCRAEKIKVLDRGSIDGVDAEAVFNPGKVSAESARPIRERHQIPPDALVAGFVGRLVRDKGLIELVAAWRTLREEFAALHLLLAGPFESQDPLPTDVEAVLRSDPRIHLLGDVLEMPPVYRAIDLLVLPTYREGLPTVPLEAAAMELPVVATRIPGCVDAVRDGETGLLVPPRDAPALASAVRQYLQDPELRRRHGTNGRQWMLREFNPSSVRATLFQEYLRLLQQRGVGERTELADLQCEAAVEQRIANPN